MDQLSLSGACLRIRKWNLMEISWNKVDPIYLCGFRKYPIPKTESLKQLVLLGDWMQLLIHDLAYTE